MRRPTWSWYISLLSGPVFLPFHRALSCFAAAFVQTAQNQLVAKQVVDAGAEEELLEEEAAVRTRFIACAHTSCLFHRADQNILAGAVFVA
eukprot:m.71755 g.71755  ORF g.71755 m.71755 type:complete len:91 (-) comp50207_c0_seq1:75-347(-)